MVSFTSDQWIIVALVFVLGLLIGAFLTAGGRRKWKTRYRDEVERRESIEREHDDHMRQMEERDREWAERDRNRSGPASRDTDADGVRDDVDRRPTDDRRA